MWLENFELEISFIRENARQIFKILEVVKISGNFFPGGLQKCQKMNQENVKMSENEPRKSSNVRKFLLTG